MKLLRWWRRADPRRLAVGLLALWKLARHAQTPWPAQAVAWLVLAYALSPIDLIPDFIPLLGQLDELVLVPLGVALAVRLTPAALWQARWAEAEASLERLPRLRWAAALVLAVWALVAAGVVALLLAALTAGCTADTR